jgi:hypothetical protein
MSRLPLVLALTALLPLPLMATTPMVGEGRIIDAPMLDLNGDGLVDAIIVKDQDGNPGANRDVILAFRNDKGELHPAWHNARLIPCATCAGPMGDPYDTTTAQTGRFSVSLRGGGREKWSTTYTFVFDKKANRFFLNEVENINTDVDTGRSTRTVLTTRELGRVEFSDFDPDHLPDPGLSAPARAPAAFELDDPAPVRATPPVSRPAASISPASGAVDESPAATCPGRTFPSFFAEFQNKEAVQRRWTTDPVEGETVGDDGNPVSRPWRFSQMSWPLIPSAPKVAANGAVTEASALPGGGVKIKLYKPDTDYQMYYFFKKTGDCWTLYRIEDESL